MNNRWMELERKVVKNTIREGEERRGREGKAGEGRRGRGRKNEKKRMTDGTKVDEKE